MSSDTTFKQLPYAAADAYHDNRLDDLDFLLDQWTQIAIDEHLNMYGEAVFMRHTYNGLIALDNGDVTLAKKELLMAGRAPKSAALYSFGPNMSLAKRLLEKGERETVLLFLKYCRAFWMLPFWMYFTIPWKRAIREGKTPDFKMHLKMFMQRPPEMVN